MLPLQERKGRRQPLGWGVLGGSRQWEGQLPALPKPTLLCVRGVPLG